ncbi:unnamed protein product [Dibothriocephalus latus]|uniref:Thioredoxin domain-containing protein 17 n=1 Tax=Dibothriocephalus latus TaxID=60516 RepID=A0A3P7LIQ0_DIBLA|nr:unnamed protein product [Dibothriocephalus latus]
MAYLHVKELLESIAQHADKRCFVYAIASPDETGQSWCPDCRRVQPSVDEARMKLPENAMWFDVHTGDRPTWKDPQNEFRVCSELNIQKVPTLLEFGTDRRLTENQVTLSNMLDIKLYSNHLLLMCLSMYAGRIDTSRHQCHRWPGSPARPFDPAPGREHSLAATIPMNPGREFRGVCIHVDFCCVEWRWKVYRAGSQKKEAILVRTAQTVGTQHSLSKGVFYPDRSVEVAKEHDIGGGGVDAEGHAECGSPKRQSVVDALRQTG